MTYNRVIPRDLFNESKLLKCLGKLYIAAERHTPGHVLVRFVDGALDGQCHDGFGVTQDQSDGSMYAQNVAVYVNNKRVIVATPLNSRDDLPLYAQWDDEFIPVFKNDGTLTSAFLQIGKDTT